MYQGEKRFAGEGNFEVREDKGEGGKERRLDGPVRK